MLQLIKNKLLDAGVEKTYLLDAASAIALLATLFACLVAYQITNRLLHRALRWLWRTDESNWLQVLVSCNFFDRLAHLAPVAVLTVGATLAVQWEEAIETAASLYFILVVCLVVAALLDAAAHLYLLTEVGKRNARPINSYVDVGKIIVFSLGSLAAIAIVFHQSVWTIVSGIGAVTAIVVLIFRDSLLGLVASVQISAYDLVRIGDWIEIPKYNIDGTVMDINLNTMRIQNFDNSVSVLPTYVAISESFRNWRGMQESGARRIRRAYFVDVTGLRPVAPEDRAVIAAEMPELLGEGEALTNLGLMQAYLLRKIAALPAIHSGYPLVVRQLPMQEAGIPIEVYCFSRERELIPFEALQTYISELVLVSLPRFGLQLFQKPSVWGAAQATQAMPENTDKIS